MTINDVVTQYCRDVVASLLDIEVKGKHAYTLHRVMEHVTELQKKVEALTKQPEKEGIQNETV